MSNLKERAEAAMPGGVNSPVRAFKAVGGQPIFATSGKGATLETTDGRKFIDYCMSFGPLILGHAHADVAAAIALAAGRGTSYAVTTEAEIEMAELIQAAIPSIDRVRLVSSGTEACMTALRLARGATGRNKILKFSGCYHGHTDGMLVQAGSGVAGIASASSSGVPEGVAAETLVAPYNDIDQVTKLVETHGHDLAAIAVEPIAANMGLVLPGDDFLQQLRSLCDKSGALLIFDEVITGFRFTFGGYQNVCGITPDLTCLGKVIGGGMPIGAVGGKEQVMNHLAPLGSVYQAGTLSGNPVSVAAGLATLRRLQNDNPYAALHKVTEKLVDEIRSIAATAGVAVQIPTTGSMFSMFFTGANVRSFEDVQTSDTKQFTEMYHRLLEAGVYLPPSPFEVSFLSIAHDDDAIEKTLTSFRAAFAQ